MEKVKLRNDAINFLSNCENGDKVRTKLKNICGKTGRYNVPEELFQKRTHKKSRALISWKTVQKNKLTLKQLETFFGGIVVEFINEDYFQNDSDPGSLFNILKNRVGSDEIVSSMISIRNEDGGSASSVARKALSVLKKEIPDYKNNLIRRKKSIGYSGIGNDKWEGYIYYSIKGGQQNTILSHPVGPFPQLFNPACEFANKDICLDIDLVLSYFAMFSINKLSLDSHNKKIYFELLKNIKCELKKSEYDSGNLLEYCDNHSCLLLEPGELFDPIQVEKINIVDFTITDKDDSRNLEFTHDEAVNKEKYYFDNIKKSVLTPSRPNNIFWSKHLSNMMQQSLSLEDYFRHEEEIVIRRKNKLNKI
jgi:hypothetical protein